MYKNKCLDDIVQVPAPNRFPKCFPGQPNSKKTDISFKQLLSLSSINVHEQQIKKIKSYLKTRFPIEIYRRKRKKEECDEQLDQNACTPKEYLAKHKHTQFSL